MYLDSTGTKRRLQALLAAGVNTRCVADQTGLSIDMVSYLRKGRNPYVTSDLAARVIGAYDALWDAGTDDTSALRAAAAARVRGYHLPMAWDDDTIDDPAAKPNLGTVASIVQMGYTTRRTPPLLDDVAIEQTIAGRRVTLTRPERSEVIRRMTAAGHSADFIADRLGTTERLITRYRAAARTAAHATTLGVAS